MRKHSVRKWIHAICDLLPLLVIPIFALAVRSDNNFTPIEVQQDNYEVITYNQIFDTSYLDSDNLDYHGLDFVRVDNGYHVVGTAEQGFTGYFFYSSSVTLNSEHTYYIRCSDRFTNFSYIKLDDSAGYLTTPRIISSAKSMRFYFQFTNSLVGEQDFYLIPNIFDLTLMFGFGNEPTMEQFDIWFPNDFYTYDLGTKQLLNVGSVTYNDTDVGSQMVYTLYQTTNKYFNFNNVGVFQDLYNWFETNMFNGIAPMSFYIVWNVILFEFIMDLIFLTYMVFMFVIDFTECMIDRFFEKSYRGGR